MGEVNRPILGQEAIASSYGLGRVISYSDEMPDIYVEVQTYADGIARKYAPHNVELVEIGKSKRAVLR